MCGIAGVISWSDKHRVNREMLTKISAAIAHRGPDGEGLWLNHEDKITTDHPQVGFVHRRLAILDPDPRSNQPFTDGRGRWLVFNGEIYNFRELRRELQSLLPDYRWRTTGDTEVLLASYAAWGEKCVERLNGMFAFAVWDDTKKGDTSLFLARDRMGQKPLFILPSEDRSSIAFASELSALRIISWAKGEIDHNSLIEYLQWGFVPGTQTFYSDTRKLLPGSISTGADGLPQKYFSPSPQLDISVAAATIRSATQMAVRRQLVSDVPIGCFLSGGVDSSVIVASMVKATGNASNVHTFSIGFEDPRYDESAYAKAVAEHFGTRHQTFRVRANAANDLPRLAAVFGEPFADSSALPAHYLAGETRRHVKVALSGDGGDELFGGYERYHAMQLEQAIRRLPRSVRSSVSGWTEQWPIGHPKSVISKVSRFLRSIKLPPAQRYASYLRFFHDAEIAQLIGADPNTKYAEYLVQLWDKSGSTDRDPVRQALAVDRAMYLPDDLLTKVDRTSMLHNLEVRSPFMDHELVQFAAGLTTDQLLRGGPKRMLREAFADDLPAWVFKRKKMGFAVPIGDWFRGELRPMLRDHLFATDSFAREHFNLPFVERLVDEHEQSRVDHSQRLYALLMLELWWRAQMPKP